MKPYLDATRIATDETTKEEFEYPVVLLWASVSRVEHGPEDGSFKNKAPKTVLFTPEGNVWILAPFQEIRTAWTAWIDANGIQLTFSRS